ncbi:MAG TPA: hypothetical protein VMZ90_06840 [Vicinamibacterales bacterium]|nr:hypothetical protein [Vicinamibacterales bacterium]
MDLSSAARQAMGRLAADLTRVFGDRFVALIATGPTRTAGFATAIRAGDLEALSALTQRWQLEGLDTPLLITPHEFVRSLDAFPVEYQAMLDRHELIAGVSPFSGERPAEADLRRACEVQAKSFLIHLRQGWLQASDHHHEQAQLVSESAAPLRALIGNVARLHGVGYCSDQEIVAFAGTIPGVAADLVSGVLSLDGRPELAKPFMPRMNEYLMVAERLWAYVDGWGS